jgi:cytochrome c-type biogenesis protein CcmE
MHPLRKRRLLIVLFIVAAASAATALVVWALRDNMNFFYAPASIARGEAPRDKTIRVGGMVVPGSVERSASGLEIAFTITDYEKDVVVSYQGILPDLFAEGQGIVAVGELQQGNRFRASQVLAKHDENYMPPEVKSALDAARPAMQPTGGKP